MLRLIFAKDVVDEVGGEADLAAGLLAPRMLPLDEAADVAVRTVMATPTRVADVRFVLFNDEVLAQFRRAWSEAAG